MKWCLPLALLSCVMIACSSKTNSQNESMEEPSATIDSTFNSEKFQVSFISQLPEETLQQAQSFVDTQIESVVLIRLLPDCQILDGEEQCYETSVLTTSEGDSLKMRDLSNLKAIRIDETRLGIRKSLRQEDIKKLLPSLFAGDEKEIVSFCYVPRHAIALYGENDQMTGFIEICFECSESILIIDSFNIPPLNQEALNGLGELFMAYGFEEKPSQNE